MKEIGVKHTFSDLYHPATNGATEYFVAIFKDKISKILKDGKNMNRAINLRGCAKLYKNMRSLLRMECSSFVSFGALKRAVWFSTSSFSYACVSELLFALYLVLPKLLPHCNVSPSTAFCFWVMMKH